MNPNELNPYKSAPVERNRIVSSGSPDNPPIRTLHASLLFALAFLSGTAALIGLALGIYSITLIASAFGIFGQAGYLAYLAIPIGAIALFFSCILLAFGIKGIRDVYLQVRQREVLKMKADQEVADH